MRRRIYSRCGPGIANPVATHETLGLILVRRGVITRPELYDALRLQRSTGRLLGTCLIELGTLDGERLLAFLAEQLGAPICRRKDLERADPTAVARLSASSARALLAFPVGWDGTTLQLAIANGAILSRLSEVEIETRCAVRPLVALERDVLAVIEMCHGQTSTEPGHALLDTPGARGRPPTPSLPPRVVRAAPPRAPITRRTGRPPTQAPLERIGLYEAIEQLYEARTSSEVARHVGRALLNYFARVLVLRAGQVIGHAGVTPQYSELKPATARLFDQLAVPALHYGATREMRRAAALAADLRIGRPPHALIATTQGEMLYYADNDDAPEAYEDLHDLELLFKEASTALGLLPEQP